MHAQRSHWENVAVDKGLIAFVDVLPPPGLHDIQECLISFYKSFADIYSLGFVLKAMVVIKFGSLWEPVLKSATDSNQQVLPILQWNIRDSSHQELPALLMAAMIKIGVVVMDV